MKGFDNQTFLIAYIISNVLALVILVVTWKNVRVGRTLFFILFSWACFINLKTVLNNPSDYLNYAGLTHVTWYRHFIEGWFSEHITLCVVSIAIGQGMIAIAMLLKGIILKIGSLGAIIFFLSIAPLGMGSAFPCSVIAAIAVYFILKTQNQKYLWISLSRQPPKQMHRDEFFWQDFPEV